MACVRHRPFNFPQEIGHHLGRGFPECEYIAIPRRPARQRKIIFLFQIPGIHPHRRHRNFITAGFRKGFITFSRRHDAGQDTYRIDTFPVTSHLYQFALYQNNRQQLADTAGINNLCLPLSQPLAGFRTNRQTVVQ